MDVQVDNIKLIRLPPNCTSKMQPCDQGIILALKRRYRAIQLKLQIDWLEENPDKKLDEMPSTSSLQAMTRVKLAWYQITPDTLKNCWRKAGFGDFIGNADISMPIQDDLDKLVATINHRLDVPIG